MSHPVGPDHENTADVFRALVAKLPESEREPWTARWRAARAVERRRRDYDRKWDESLLSITRSGQ